MMKRMIWLGAAAAMAVAIATPASASKIFVLDGVTLQGGGTLVGSFTTNDAITALEEIDITASGGIYNPGNGINYNLTGFVYNDVGLVDLDRVPTGFRITTTTSAGNYQFSLYFVPDLSDAGAAIDTSKSLESEIGVHRRVTGGQVALSPGAVPEPATWAMMIGGFGLIGLAMRRRPRTRVTFA